MSAAASPLRSALAIEALGWAAAAVALLFQNPYGDLGPDADRFLVLQLLALAAIALAAVGPRVERSSPFAPHRARALTFWALASAAAATLATFAAVDPSRSLFGTPPRLLGLASTLSLVALFLVLAPRLASVASRERAETALFAATGALVAYSLVQWAGLDPLRWQVDWQGRPIAAQGNPLFLAQAFVWLVPLAAGRALACRQRGEMRAAAAAASLALAGAAVALRTGARGPLLGLAVAGVLFATLAALTNPSARIRRAGKALALLLALALVAGAGFALLRSGRLTGTAEQRVLLWGAVVRLLEASPATRLAVGYGPESLALVLPPHLPAELPERIWRPDLYHDRAHNSLLDALASGGALQLLANLGLAIAAALAVLRLAGARRTVSSSESPTPGGPAERWRFTALAAALGGQAVAGLTGVSTAATATLFWLGLAAIAGAQRSAMPAGSESANLSAKRAVEAAARRARLAARLRWGLGFGLLALVAFGAWVPEQREGDAMGGRVLFLLILAAGGIRLGLAAGSFAEGEGGDAADLRTAPPRSDRRQAVAAALAVAAVVGLAGFVVLPQIASGVLLKQGRTALDAGRADLAKPLLERAHRRFPDFEDPSVALARAEQRLGERAGAGPERDAAFDRAAAVLAEARGRHPELSQLALEEAYLAARRADATGDPAAQKVLFERAVAAYREVLPRDPRSASVHRGLGAALLALGRVDEAGEAIATSARLAPRSVESRLLLGRQRLFAGDEAGARAAFEAARSLDPLRSRQLLEGLARARPDDPTALRDLALFEIVEGRRKQALEALQRALALTPPEQFPPLVRLTGLASALP